MKIFSSSLRVQLHLLFTLHYLNFCLCHHNFHKQVWQTRDWDFGTALWPKQNGLLVPLAAVDILIGRRRMQIMKDSVWGGRSSTVGRASQEPQQEAPGADEDSGFLPLCWLLLWVSQGDWPEKEPALCWGVWEWTLPSPCGAVKAPLSKGRQAPLVHVVPQGRLRYPACEGKMLLKAHEGLWEAGECSSKQKTRFSKASTTEDRVGMHRKSLRYLCVLPFVFCSVHFRHTEANSNTEMTRFKMHAPNHPHRCCNTHVNKYF